MQVFCAVLDLRVLFAVSFIRLRGIATTRSQIVLGCQLCPAPLITPAPTAEALSIAAATGQLPTYVFEASVQPTISMPAIASAGLREACNVLCFTVTDLCGACGARRAPAAAAQKFYFYF